MPEGMTNAEFNAFLETLAQLVEAKAKTPEQAAALIRQAKAEDEAAARAALAEISRREYRAKEAEFLSTPALCEHISPSKCDCIHCGARDLCAWLCEHDPSQQPTI